MKRFPVPSAVTVRIVVRDAIGICGFIAIIAGVAELNHAAAVILCGTAMFTSSVALARKR